MPTDDYIAFQSFFKADAVQTIVAQHLSGEIKEFVRTKFSRTRLVNEEELHYFFTHVAEVTGEMRELSGDRPYSNLIASWGKKGRNRSATLATATYYTLHTMKWGQEIAHDIDRKLFGGATFLEKHGCSVPGGYSEPSEQDDETSTELSDLLVDFQWRGFNRAYPVVTHTHYM